MGEGKPELQVDVGDVLQLQPVDGERELRYAVKVIGYLPGESLIVTAPRTRSGLILVREGQPFTVRVLVDSRIYGFTTQVLKSNARPYPYLHLSYPRELESVVVRKSTRATTDLIVSVRRTEAEPPTTARLLDISTTGARFSASRAVADVDEEVDIAVRFTIGELEEYVRLPARVRRKQMEEGEERGATPAWVYGVEFRPLPPATRLAVYAYVYSRLAG